MLSCTTSVRALLHGRQRTLYAVSARLSTAAVSAAQSSAAEKLLFASIKDASAALARGDTSSLALTNACLEQIERTKATNAYTAVLAESARTAAAASDAHRASGAAPRPLEGIPIAVKDNFCVDGAISSAASRVLEGFVAPYDATVVARLRAAGAVIVGKTNMDEFGMGSHTSNTPHGPTFAPLPPPSAPASGAAAPALWDRSAGGSSGGSAAAVAAGTCFAALGSDTGGSVRLPAAYTGTVGLKPTYGLLSRWGLIAYASSLDCPGILTRSCSDAAAVVEAVQGADELDSTCIFSLSSPATSAGAGAGDSKGSLAGVRVGLPRELMLPELSAPVARAWDSAAAALAAEGAEVVTVGLPLLAAVLPVYYTVAPAEAVSNLSRYDGVRYGPSSAPAVPLPAAASPTAAPAGEAGTAAAVTPLQAMYTATRTAFFGPEVRRRISVGNFVLSSAHYQSFFGRAMALRGEIAAQMVGVLRSTGLSEPAAAAEVSVAAQEQEQAQGQVDLLLLPTATSGAPRLSDLSARAAADPLADLLDDVMTVGPSLAGLPALSVPAGKDAEGLPLGVQLVGPALSERALLRIGQIIADATRDNK